MRWLNRILHDAKTWEIRSRNTKTRGRIALVFKKRALGEVDVVDSFPLTQELFHANMGLHQVPGWEWVTERYTRPHVWVLANPQQTEPARQVVRTPGQVTWVKI